MQGEDKVRFLKHHQGSVRGVAFHPKVHMLTDSQHNIEAVSAKYVRPNEMSSKNTTGPVKVPL